MLSLVQKFLILKKIYILSFIYEYSQHWIVTWLPWAVVDNRNGVHVKIIIYIYIYIGR